MKNLHIFCLFLVISGLANSVPRVPLTPSKSPAPHLLAPFLSDPDRLDLDTYPFIVDATFRDGDPKLPMGLAFHTSKTFVANCPGQFQVFECSLYPNNCLAFPDMPFQFDNPFYSLSGVMMDLKLSIGNYVKSRPASIYYAQTCTGHGFHTKDIVGVLGLSISDNNNININTQDSKYSIYLQEDGTKGELIFGTDMSHADGEWNATLTTNYDWEFKIFNILFGDSNYNMNSDAIFDLSVPFVGVPAPFYKLIVKELEEKWLLTCQQDVVLPECLYPDDINLLPEIKFRFWNSLGHIDLHPSVYLRKVRDNRYQLMIAGLAIDPHSTGLVHVTPSYVNYVILGHPFLKHYYTVFNFADLRNPVINLYKSKGVDENNSDGGKTGVTWLAIVLGVVVLGGLIACVWAINKSRTKAYADVNSRRQLVPVQPVLVNPVVDRPPIHEPLVARGTLVAQ